MAPPIWIPEHGDAGLIVPADHILEREGERGPESPQIDPERRGAVSQSPPAAGGQQAPPAPAQRRKLSLLLRQAQRRWRRRQVRADNRLLHWAHRAGRGPRPPIQAVKAPGRYLAAFVWDEEHRRWSSPQPPLRKSPEQAAREARRRRPPVDEAAA